VPAPRARRGTPFTAQERQAILGTFREAWEAKERAELDDDDADTAEPRRIMAEAARAYEDGVPIVAISRSPLSGEVFEVSIDTFDLDGLWWAYDYEYRPFVEPPRDLFAWTGALKLDGPVPEWSLKAMPGPDVPFILPGLMALPGMTAVISSLRIGRHVGFPICYYADPLPQGVERADDWGIRSYTYQRPDGTFASAHAVQSDEEKDFELRPWLESGRVHWIAPGDDSLTLHRGADGCPYVDLPGERRRRYIERGGARFAV
jgi:hypothetical protein